MNRIYAFAVGLAILVAPLATTAIAAADPGTRAMDYQQATDVVVQRGLSQRGVPFAWAGGGISGPSRGKGSGVTSVGYDASGLMQYSYAGAGVRLPRSSGEIYRTGQKVLPQQAQKGDLICYGPNGSQSVAMYLGNNQMLEVGDVVQVSPVRTTGMMPYLVRVVGAQPAPVQQAPVQQIPTQQAPLSPGQQAPGQLTPGQPMPAQQVPAQQIPTQQAPLSPVQQAPALQSPNSQAPTIQLPAAQPAPLAATH